VSTDSAENQKKAAQGASAHSYVALIRKAARGEQLTDVEVASLLVSDRAFIADTLRKTIAVIDAWQAGYDIRPRPISDRRADDIVRHVRRGGRVTALSLDEQAAIDHTPGLWDRIFAAASS
jgi:hypothetical protein